MAATAERAIALVQVRQVQTVRQDKPVRTAKVAEEEAAAEAAEQVTPLVVPAEKVEPAVLVRLDI